MLSSTVTKDIKGDCAANYEMSQLKEIIMGKNNVIKVNTDVAASLLSVADLEGDDGFT